jgi:hypothetical protein
MAKKSSADLDHTDELPVLLETVVIDEGGMPHLLASSHDDTSEQTALFTAADPPEPVAELQAEIAAREAKIAAVEADIARLSSRWQDVERILAEKDTSIAELNATIDALRRSLADRSASEQRLGAELAERDAQLRDVSNDWERAGRDRDVRDQEILKLQTELAETQQAVATLTAERAAASAPAVDPAEIQALREHNAALEAYIAGRRAWWDESQAAQIDLAKRVAALEHELAVTTQQLDDAAALSTRESERATALRTQLVDFARRLETSERELRATRGDLASAMPDPPSAALPSPVAAARPQTDLAPPPAPLPMSAPVVVNADTDADSVRSQDIEAIAQLEAEVGYKRQQVAAQLIELRDREQRLTAVTTEAERLRHHVATTQAELQQSRSDVARLERAILDKDRALQARDARIATLQSELDQRLGAMQKLTSMDASLQGLHSRMSEQLRVTEQNDVQSPELICLTGDAPKRFALTRRSITVGRSPRCDLQIVTHFVSREHARISMVDDAAVIEDLGSRNGVFVNAVKISRQRLQQGDLITIGETQFRFIESAAH